jgi:hypothetical protein
LGSLGVKIKSITAIAIVTDAIRRHTTLRDLAGICKTVDFLFVWLAILIAADLAASTFLAFQISDTIVYCEIIFRIETVHFEFAITLHQTFSVGTIFRGFITVFRADTIEALNKSKSSRQ